MTALTATQAHVGSTLGVPAARPARTRHLVSVPTGDAVVAAPKPALRLTRRGRLAITIAAVALASATGVGVAFGGQGVATEQVTVEPGQTLTSIAEAEMAGVPTREAIAQIQIANNLASSHVHAGQTLVIPVR